MPLVRLSYRAFSFSLHKKVKGGGNSAAIVFEADTLTGSHRVALPFYPSPFTGKSKTKLIFIHCRWMVASLGLAIRQGLARKNLGRSLASYNLAPTVDK